MLAPILIAQISDLHIKRRGTLAYGQVDTAAALARCIVELNRFMPQPELVVISGDLVDTPTEEEYAHLQRLLAPLEIPLAAVPGNHDDRSLFRAAFPSQPYAQAKNALNFSLAVGPLDLVLIDSSVPGAPHGSLDADTLGWLDATLANDSSRPALLFLHHPPFVTGIEHMDRQNLRNASELSALVQRHPRARLIAAGHVHRATLATFAGIAATICRSEISRAHIPSSMLRASSCKQTKRRSEINRESLQAAAAKDLFDQAPTCRQGHHRPWRIGLPCNSPAA